jgi:hypothetical protein
MSFDIAAGDPGDAAIFVANPPPVPQLPVRIETRAQSAASIASIAIERATYTDYPNTTIKANLALPAPIAFDASDADGYIAFPGVPLTATGPSLAPSASDGGPCTTDEDCYLHPSLPDGTDELDTYVDVTAGAGHLRFPVHISR